MSIPFKAKPPPVAPAVLLAKIVDPLMVSVELYGLFLSSRNDDPTAPPEKIAVFEANSVRPLHSAADPFVT